MWISHEKYHEMEDTIEAIKADNITLIDAKNKLGRELEKAKAKISEIELKKSARINTYDVYGLESKLHWTIRAVRYSLGREFYERDQYVGMGGYVHYGDNTLRTIENNNEYARTDFFDANDNVVFFVEERVSVHVLKEEANVG